MRVLLVTTWGVACGISEHSAYLKEAVEGADPSIEIEVSSTLDPCMHSIDTVRTHPIIHLNYHAALHSQWTPDWIRNFRSTGAKVLVTYHDSGVPNTQQAKDVCAAADAFVVHEPYDDLEGNGRYWRQGVPGWAHPCYICKADGRALTGGQRPVVGTVGFPFPWKNYDLLCAASALAGWGVLLLAPNATPADVERWTALNPEIAVRTDFTPRDTVVSALTGCDATAFLYSCQNGGTSGAIRQGIAARKPVLALQDCRQFRDVYSAPHENGIWWLDNGSAQHIANVLSRVPMDRVYAPMVALAARDSWARSGAAYAALYKQLVQKETV